MPSAHLGKKMNLNYLALVLSHNCIEVSEIAVALLELVLIATLILK